MSISSIGATSGSMAAQAARAASTGAARAPKTNDHDADDKVGGRMAAETASSEAAEMRSSSARSTSSPAVLSTLTMLQAAKG